MACRVQLARVAPRLALATVASLGATMLTVACDSDDGRAVGPVLELDERKGTADGVGLGDSAAEIERVFGSAPPYDIYTEVTPLGVDPPDLTLAGQGGCRPHGRENALRYRGVSFFQYDDEVCDVIVTSERAATTRGLSPGDPLARVEDLYPRLECGETDVGSDYPSYEPVCWGAITSHSHLWAGGDPINVLVMEDRPVRPNP